MTEAATRIGAADKKHQVVADGSGTTVSSKPVRSNNEIR